MEITIFGIIILPRATTIIITVNYQNTRIQFINEAYSTLIGFKHALPRCHNA